MEKIFIGLGVVLLTILKYIGMLILGVLRMVLELAKMILLLFGIIVRVFLAFVRAGTS